MSVHQDPLLAETLRAAPLFGHLPDESDACFAALRQGAVRDFGPGEILLPGGDRDKAVFLLQGAVRTGPEGPVVAAPGSYFGVFELIAHRPADHHLTALTSVRAFVLQRNALDALLETCPGLVMRLLSDCAHRLLAKERTSD